VAGAYKDHFSTRAADYAAFRPRYPVALVEHLASIAPARGLVLDAGCGTGQLSVLLAQRFERVIATDASAAQIAHAEPHERVVYRVAPAERSGLDDAGADLVTVAQAAHWFALDSFYAEVRRVLRPGGVLALITYGVIEADGEVGAVLKHFYYDVFGPFWPPERRHVESGYRTLPFPFEELTAPPLAMRATWPLDGLIGYVDTWSAVRQAEKTLGREPMMRLTEALQAVWGDPAAVREISWPLAIRLGRA